MENVIIKASAGTGKTHQLACRYLLLLFSGVRPENILATTFTKKAAEEILNRILSWLAKGALNEKECADLADKLSSAKKETQIQDRSPVKLKLGEVRNTLYEVIKCLNRINVSTLDSYFNQRTQCFSLELELPMDWKIIDKSLDNRYRQAVLSTLFQNEDIVNSFTQYIRISDLKRSVYTQMSDTVEGLYSLWREAPSEAWEALRVPKFKFTEEEFHNLVSVTIELLNSRDTTLTEKQRASIAADLKSLCEEEPFMIISNFLEKKALPKSAWSVRKSPRDGIAFSNKIIDDPDIVKCLIQITEYVQVYLVYIKRSQSDFYCKTLQEFDSLYMASKKKMGQLLFEDIPWLLTKERFVKRQLNDTGSFRMDSSIQHLMLDEFQDTSLVQWRVLEPLARQTATDDNCSFFCVGDVKQAIYGWRGGECQLLDSMGELLKPAAINEIEMKKSRRSGKAIMEAVNQTFMNLGDNPLLLKSDDPQTFHNSAKQWSERFPEHESHQAHMESYVKMRSAPLCANASDEDKKDSESLRMMTYEYVAEMLEKDFYKQSEERGLSIGILVQKNVVGAAIADCIKRRGMECSLEGKSPLLDSYEVCQILALMKWIDHPDDAYSYYQVCNSPLARELGLKDVRKTVSNASQRLTVNMDDCRILNRLRYELFCNGYGLTVQRWSDLLKPEANARSRRRLEMLEELANKYDSQGTTRTDEFVEYINGASVLDAFKTRIRIMTYHQSKGLEFDIVILPQLDAPLVINDSTMVVYGRPSKIDRPDRIIRSFNSGHRYLLTEDQQKLFTIDEEKQMQESLCNLYVAMTRAKRGLYIILPPLKTGSHKTYEDVLLGTLTNGVDRKNKEPGIVYYECGDSKWINSIPLKEDKEENKKSDVTLQSGVKGVQNEPVLPLPGEKLEVSGGFAFKSGARPVCIPLPASAWTTSAKPSSFVNVVTVEVDNLGSSGSLLAQSTRGTLFHCWLADIEWLEEYCGDDKRLIDLGIGIGLQQESFMELLPAFKSLLKHPNVISALERPDNSWEAYREKNAAGILKDEKEREYLVSGVIDRLTLHRSADGKVDKAIVLDFKTVKKDSNMSVVRARYAGQMDAYRQIVSKTYRIPVGDVETTLLVLKGDF